MNNKTKIDKYSQYDFSSLDGHSKNVEHVAQPPAKLRSWIIRNSMLLVTVSGVVFGIIEGSVLRQFQLSEDSILLVSYPGEIFMRIIKLMMLPLIFSLDVKMSGRIAMRAFGFFFATSLLNAIFGISLGLIVFHNSNGSNTTEVHVASKVGESGLQDSLMDLGRNLVPDNLFQALFQQVHTVYVTVQKVMNATSENDAINETRPEFLRELRYRSVTNTMGIVFFCLTFGTFLGTIGPKGKIINGILAALFEVSLKMISTIILWVAPLGISSLIASRILSIENVGEVMSLLTVFVLTATFGIFFYQLIGLQLIYFAFFRKNPFKFYGALLEAFLTAFATSSSSATLPVAFRVTENVLGIDTRITRFVLPVGVSVNTDGAAFFMAFSTIFLTQMRGMALGISEYVSIIITVTLTSMSGINIPSGSLILLPIVLESINAPVEDITLLFTVDWLLDRMRTSTNVLSDCYAAAIVEKFSQDDLRALDKAAAAAAAAEIQHPEQNYDDLICWNVKNV